MLRIFLNNNSTLGLNPNVTMLYPADPAPQMKSTPHGEVEDHTHTRIYLARMAEMTPLTVSDFWLASIGE